MRRFVLTLFFCLAALLAMPVPQFRFQLLTTSDGLTNSTVRCMHIDSKGFLWIGTDDGLNRYDGYKINLFEKTVGIPMQLHTIDELQEDAQGMMWIDSEFSYTLYNVNTQRLVSSPDEYLKSLGIDTGNATYKIKTDEMGGLWIFQEGKLTHYDFVKKNTQTWRNSHIHIEGLYPSNCTASHDQILFSYKGSVWQFKCSDGKMNRLELPAEMEQRDNIFGTYIDADRTVWIYSIVNDCLCRYISGGKVIKEMVKLPQSASRNNAIRHLIDDGKGNLWIATDHEGIFVYSKQTGEISNIKNHDNEYNTLSSNNSTYLVKDSQGTIWIGHFKTGISYAIANNSMFVNKGQQYGDVNVLVYDQKGNLWIGTDGDGLYVEHPDGTYEKTSLPNITISSIVADKDGTMWVGTFSEGLYHVITPTRHEQYCTRNGRLATDRVWSLIDDGNGYLWCGSLVQPLVKFNKQTGKGKVVRINKNEDIIASSFCFDNRGRLLITTTYGLVICNPKTDQCHRLLNNNRGTQEMLNKMAVLECYDPTTDILLMGHKRGFTIFDMKRDTLYYINDEVNGIVASPKSLIRDKKGNVWISTSRGIECMQIARQKSGELKLQVKNYSYREGLYTPFFNQNASAIDSAGNIVFGETMGYTLISPQAILEHNHHHLVPFITDVSVEDKLVEIEDNEVILDYDAQHISIQYFTGNINTHNSILYAYKIEGKMNDWAYTEDNHITLVGLSPNGWDCCGRYKIDNFRFYCVSLNTTAIDSVKQNQSETNAAYNLMGVKVNPSTVRGMYIMNGKKYFK